MSRYISSGVTCWPLFASHTMLMSRDMPVPCLLHNLAFATGIILIFCALCVIFLIALEKYLYVVFPYFHHKHITLCTLLVPFTIVASIVTVVIFINIIYEPVKPKLIMIFLDLLVFFFSFLLISLAFLYKKIINVAHAHVETIALRYKNEGTSLRREKRALKTSIIIIGTTTACFLPYIVIDE